MQDRIAKGRAVPLKLPVGDHALLLTIGPVPTRAFTIDGRTDDDQGLSSVRYRLWGYDSVAHPSLPGWAKYPF